MWRCCMLPPLSRLLSSPPSPVPLALRMLLLLLAYTRTLAALLRSWLLALPRSCVAPLSRRALGTLRGGLAAALASLCMGSSPSFAASPPALLTSAPMLPASLLPALQDSLMRAVLVLSSALAATLGAS